MGGAGRLVGPGHLVLEGSPYQMGWWQGRLLEDRIRRLHREWPERAFREAAAGDAERAAALRDACRLYAAHTLPLLPERLRQELEGLAAGSGVSLSALLLTEVQRYALRWHEGEPRLLGGALTATADATSLAYAPAGPDAAALADDWILVERRPEGGTSTILITWPGSLGGVAGASARGIALAAAEDPAPVERQSLRGVPFLASLRVALERADGAEAAVAALARTTTHRVAALEPRKGTVLHAVLDHVEAVIEAGPPPADAAAPGSPEAPLRIRWRDGGFDLSVPGAETRGFMSRP